jgi:hypothetical protein
VQYVNEVYEGSDSLKTLRRYAPPLTDTYCHDIDAIMDKEPDSDIAVGIAEALRVGATLGVRLLARGTSLTSRDVLAALGNRCGPPKES